MKVERRRNLNIIMVYVIISIGSNSCQAAHVQWASQRLAGVLGDVRFSRTLWTEDIHGTGVFYMNRLAGGYTTLTAEELTRRLKDIEAETGRTKQRVTIDLDLMEYDNERFHLADWSRPYVQNIIDDIL